jgi:WD repeat-containing protein 48
VANWCAVDTKTGYVTVMLEENYCFDAEVYADEIDIPEKIDFREDQRINLGKWVLRNLFTTLLDEEIRRDEIYRKSLQKKPDTFLRSNAPSSIEIPDSSMGTPEVSPGTMTTPRANGPQLPPVTPGLAIGSVTPGDGLQSTPGTMPMSPTPEDDNSLEKAVTRQSQPSNGAEVSNDYFSSSIPVRETTPAQESESSSENKVPMTPGDAAQLSVPTSPTEEKKKSTLFGKKFQMGFPKKLARQSAEVKPPTATEERSDTASNKSSDREEKAIQDNLMGVVQKIRQEYDEHVEGKPDEPVPIGITPSPPIETPVLKPPPHTLIIIQEDNPESGGLADQYRGEIGKLGLEADVLEKIAPTWLGELLLKVSGASYSECESNVRTEPNSVQRHGQSVVCSSPL